MPVRTPCLPGLRAALRLRAGRIHLVKGPLGDRARLGALLGAKAGAGRDAPLLSVHPQGYLASLWALSWAAHSRMTENPLG